MEEKPKKKWMGTIYTNCQLCSCKLGKVFYDACVSGTAWAVICHSCFTSHRCRLGTGAGQKYDTKTLEKLAG
jgi:hypothetical protein